MTRQPIVAHKQTAQAIFSPFVPLASVIIKQNHQNTILHLIAKVC